MSPEVLIGNDYTFPTDIWSIGIISYLLLIGCLPFDDQNNDDSEIARKIVEEEANFSERRWRRISPAGKKFVQSKN